MSIKKPGASMISSSPRPKARPAGMKNPAEMKSSPRPMARPDDIEERAALRRAIKNSQPDKLEGMAKGGKIKMVEKGGKKVPAFAADGVGKMAMGGMCRGMGAATKGGKYKG